MADERAHLPIENDLRPAYYDDFHCLAAGCKLSCCKGWSITFGKKDYLSLKRQKGSLALNERLESGLRRIRKYTPASGHYGEFVMDSGICPLLGEDSLCTLQIEKGHQALPDVCRTYPRSETYMTSGYLERSLSPSCEGVLALLWDLPNGIEFRSDPLPKSQHKQVSFSVDNPLPMWFPVVREWCIDTLQDRRFPLPHRIWLLGLGLKELADGETDIERWMERAALLPNSVDPGAILQGSEKELAMVLTGNLRTLLSLQSGDVELHKARGEMLKSLSLEIHVEEKKMGVPTAAYQKAVERYAKEFIGKEYFMENLLVSVFFHLHMPHMASREELWKGYVNFCNLFSFRKLQEQFGPPEVGGEQGWSSRQAA